MISQAPASYTLGSQSRLVRSSLTRYSTVRTALTSFSDLNPSISAGLARLALSHVSVLPTFISLALPDSASYPSHCRHDIRIIATSRIASRGAIAFHLAKAMCLFFACPFVLHSLPLFPAPLMQPHSFAPAPDRSPIGSRGHQKTLPSRLDLGA